MSRIPLMRGTCLGNCSSNKESISSSSSFSWPTFGLQMLLTYWSSPTLWSSLTLWSSSSNKWGCPVFPCYDCTGCVGCARAGCVGCDCAGCVCSDRCGCFAQPVPRWLRHKLSSLVHQQVPFAPYFSMESLTYLRSLVSASKAPKGRRGSSATAAPGLQRSASGLKRFCSASR